MMGGGEADQSAVARALASLDSAFAMYERILSKQAFLAGEELSLPDLFHLPYGTMAKGFGLMSILDKYKHVKEWFESMETRKSWSKLQR
jgi:glutathione S-transferase